MINQPQFRSSKSRITKQQKEYNRVSDQILSYIKSLTVEEDAEALWFGMRTEGYDLSISSFNTKLKKLVEAGLIEKRSIGYNKHFYRVCSNH
jgi:Fe2+ or Zn2+ uptake regulation protein